jgi:predicted PurR-regulated permease PerM
MHLSFQKIFYVTASVLGFFAILILAKTVLIPVAFAFLIAFILFPAARKFESWGINETVSALLAILGLFLIIGGTIYLFSNQILQLSDSLADFKTKILSVFADATILINKNFGFIPELEKGELMDKIKTWFNNSSGTLLAKTFSSSANIIFGVITSIIFAFLILIYKNGLIRSLIHFFPPEHREKAFKMFKSVQQVGQKYLFGMLIIIAIIGLVNSIGLVIIGIDNPFLFGFLAAILAVIPYAGTFIGSAIPVIYSFITYDSIWMPVTIILFFWMVQIIEGNFLTPKIVGGNLKINAFTAIVSIIIGAIVWGIAGMILFLPFVAMFKTVCEEYVELKPLALLMGKQNYTKDDHENFGSKWFTKIKSWFSEMRTPKNK